MSFAGSGMGLDDAVGIPIIAYRIRDPAGQLVGTAMISKPALGMGTIATLTSMDEQHVERMQRVAKAARRPAAVLFADLEASSGLALRLWTASYFAARSPARPGSRISASSRPVDWSAATSATASSRSSSPRRTTRSRLQLVAASRPLVRWAPQSARSQRVKRLGPRRRRPPLRVALGFDAGTVGNISTAGRTEVTALGDEVNEARAGRRGLRNGGPHARLKVADRAAGSR